MRLWLKNSWPWRKKQISRYKNHSTSQARWTQRGSHQGWENGFGGGMLSQEHKLLLNWESHELEYSYMPYNGKAHTSTVPPIYQMIAQEGPCEPHSTHLRYAGQVPPQRSKLRLTKIKQLVRTQKFCHKTQLVILTLHQNYLYTPILVSCCTKLKESPQLSLLEVCVFYFRNYDIHQYARKILLKALGMPGPRSEFLCRDIRY